VRLRTGGGDLRVTPDQLKQFEEIERTPEQAEAAIVDYVETRNLDQAAALKVLYRLWASSPEYA
jgi:hypothetical protein